MGVERPRSALLPLLMSKKGPAASGPSEIALEALFVSAEVRPLPKLGADCRPADGKDMIQQHPKHP